MEITLDQLLCGQRGIVTRINTDAMLERRLRAFGLIPGTQISCRYRTPCCSVAALELRSSVIALRARDMANIRVSVNA